MPDEAAAATQDNTEEAGEIKEVETKEEKGGGGEAASKDTTKKVETKEEVKEFTLKLEDDSPLSDSDIDRISTLAKEKGLTEEDAKTLVSGEEAAVNGYKNAQLQEVEDVRATWVEDSKSDKEFGGEEFDANTAVAKTAIDKYGSAEFKKALEDTGFGNHPEVVRTFYRIGKAMANDKLVTAESQVSGKKDTADVLYPSSASK